MLTPVPSHELPAERGAKASFLLCQESNVFSLRIDESIPIRLLEAQKD